VHGREFLNEFLAHSAEVHSDFVASGWTSLGFLDWILAYADECERRGCSFTDDDGVRRSIVDGRIFVEH